MGLIRKFFRRKKRFRGRPQPRWLTWMIIIFIAYGVIIGIRKGTPQAPNPVHETLVKAAETMNPEKIFPIQEYKNILFPSYTASLDLRDITPGSGTPAVCGQEVRIAYSGTLEDGTPIADHADKDAPRTFRIGEGKVIPAFEQGVTSMSPAGTRSVIATLNMSYGIEKFARPEEHFKPDARIRFTIELLDVSPKLPDNENSPYRIATVYENNGGTRIFCGQEVKLHVTLWALDGKKLYSTKEAGKEPISFTPGKSEVFLGLEQGVINMTRGGARTLVVPPDFQNTMWGNAPAIHFPLPKAQTVLVDVEALP